MWFLHKLFTPKTEPSFNEKEEAFVIALHKIEEKHVSYFKRKLVEIQLEWPDRIKNYYLIWKEYEYIRFDYISGSNLPENIRQECDAAYQKIWGNN